MNSKTSLVIGATLAMLAVVFGAFGAHVLKSILTQYGLDVWQKAVFYHFIHALALLLVGGLQQLPSLSDSGLKKAALSFCVGIFLFSGSLYLLAISEVKWLGMITPLGGLAFIAGWLFLINRFIRLSKTEFSDK